MVNINKINQLYVAYEEINKVRFTHPYNIDILKQKYPKAVEELKTVLPTVIDGMDEVKRNRLAYLKAIESIKDRKIRDKLSKEFDFLITPKNMASLENLYASLV